MTYSDIRNLEAESAVVSSILAKNDILMDCILKPEDFSSVINQVMFGEMQDLYSKNIKFDMVVLIQHLVEKGLLEKCGGMANVTNLAGQSVLISLFNDYQHIVKNYAIRRNLYKIGQCLTSEAMDNMLEIDDIVERVSSGVMKTVMVEDDKSDFITSQTLFKVVDNIFQPEAVGLKTGYKDLDKVLINGMRGGELIILAGRPSMGKTAFALNLARKMIANQKKVLFISLETKEEVLLQRMVYMKSATSNKKVRLGTITEDETNRIMLALDELDKQKGNLSIKEFADKSIENISIAIRKYIMRNGKPDFIVIDHLQLLTTSRKYNSRQSEVSEISGKLKALAMSIDCPVMVLSQLSRGVTQRDDKRPKMTDLRDSGSIEQDADIILLLHREQYYDDEANDGSAAEVIVAKQKDGETASIKLIFLAEFLRFEDELKPWEFGEVMKEEEIPA